MTDESKKPRSPFIVRAERRKEHVPIPPSFLTMSSPPTPPSPPTTEPVPNAVSEPPPIDEEASTSLNVSGNVVTIKLDDYVLRDPRQIHQWASLLGEAKREQMAAEGRYQHWRARATTSYMQANTKISEWRLRAVIEAMPTFEQYRTALALCERNVIVLGALLEALLNQRV